MVFAINTRHARERLEVRAKPYFVRLSDNLHIGYRKGKTLSRWVIRTRCDGRYQTRTISAVEPDDRRVADGIHTLNFQQVSEHVMQNKQTKPLLQCSFCGKNSEEVAALIAGPGVFICDACVAMCQLYLDHPAEDKKLLIENGKPVMRKGKPVFVPLSEEELRERDRLRGS